MAYKKPVWLSLLVAALILVSVGGPWSLADTSPAMPTEPVVVRLYVRDRDHLNAVAGELDIWEVHYEAGFVVAAVTPAQYQWLESLGYQLEVDVEKTARQGIQAPLDARFYYFDDAYPNPNGLYVVDFLQATAAAYPNLTRLDNIGEAWEGMIGGGHRRDIWVIRITNEDPAYGDIADKPVFFLFATIHAREVAVPELAIRYIKYLTQGYNGEGGYGLDPDVTWLVNHNVAYVLVMQNPDGHTVNEQNTSAYRRKNVDNDDGCSDPNNWGVDLNRNHSFMWNCCGGSSGSPCDETYRGPSRGSEPETQAFQNYFNTVMRDQNGPNGDDELPPAAPDDTTGIFITLHSYSDLVLWPWGFSNYGNPPNYNQLRTIGRKFADYNGYDPAGTIWYDVDGATDDWTYGKFGIPSYTFEVGPQYGICAGFFPPYDCIDGYAGRNFWAENKPALLYAHKIARTPYMTAYGPDTGEVAVTPDQAPQGLPVQLTATIADHRYGSDPLQPIYGAEYFLDAPGEDGSGTAMAPSDGSWGEQSEEVEAVVDTAALAPGKHYILVHGRNDDGDWGPFTAVFVTATIPMEPEAIGVEASPLSIPIVHGQATVTATVTLSDSTPVPGQVVTFTTDLGTVNPSTATSDSLGQAITSLSAGDITGTAHITAEAAALMDSVAVAFYVPEAPTAGFISNSPVCTATAAVFTNTSNSPPEAPVGFLWSFGDGLTSTLESPQHVYTAAGPFTVSLTASNVGGADTFTDVVTIKLTLTAALTYSPTLPEAGELVSFYGVSNGNPLAWDWDFGDESGASDQNPVHAYAAGGTYTVSLRVRNDCGWSTPQRRTITVAERPRFYLYWPLVIRDF